MTSTAVAAGNTPLSTGPTLTETMRRRVFERWMLPQRDALGRQALRFTRDRESAEDLVQETLLQAYAKLDLFRPVAAATAVMREADDRAAQAWLHAILRNRFFNDYRRRRSAPLPVSLDALGDLAPGVGVEARGPAPTGAGYSADPARRVLVEAERTAALRAVAALPDRYRIPVILVDVEGREYQEAALALGLPLNTLRSRLHRGRNLLRRRLFAWRGLPTEKGKEVTAVQAKRQA
jgi:RNA polymerase sigma-70 factor (ECF subfamily)